MPRWSKVASISIPFLNWGLVDGLSQRYGYAMQLAWKSNTEEPAIPLHPRNFMIPKMAIYIYIYERIYLFQAVILGIQPLVFGRCTSCLGCRGQDFSVAAGHHAITGRVGTLVFQTSFLDIPNTPPLRCPWGWLLGVPSQGYCTIIFPMLFLANIPINYKLWLVMLFGLMFLGDFRIVPGTLILGALFVGRPQKIIQKKGSSNTLLFWNPRR